METGNGISAGVLISLAVATAVLLGWLGVIDLPWNIVWPGVLLYGGIQMIRWVTGPSETEKPTRSR